MTEHFIAHQIEIGNSDNSLNSITLIAKILTEHHISHQFNISEKNSYTENFKISLVHSEDRHVYNPNSISKEFWQPPKFN